MIAIAFVGVLLVVVIFDELAKPAVVRRAAQRYWRGLHDRGGRP